jgi:endoplasmic reticulum resident protein 44
VEQGGIYVFEKSFVFLIFWFISRQVDAFFDFIRKQVESSLTKLSTPSDLYSLDAKKRYIVGHFDDENSENYKTFTKVASLLRDECQFVASTNKYV